MGLQDFMGSRRRLCSVLPGLIVPVAQIGHLLALKLLARDDESRPQEAIDLRSLMEVAAADDCAIARTAVNLIIERGFHRDRDLQRDLSVLLGN